MQLNKHLLLLALILTPITSVKAEISHKILKVDVYLMDSPNSVSIDEFRDSFKKARRKYLKTNVRLKLNSISIMEDERPELAAVFAYNRYDYWYPRMKQLFPTKPGLLNLLVFPCFPNPEDNVCYFSGIAKLGCDFDGSSNFAMALASPKRANGSSGMPYLRTILAHEIGHSVSAIHDNSAKPSIMNPNALYYADKGLDLNFSRASVASINRCANKS